MFFGFLGFWGFLETLGTSLSQYSPENQKDQENQKTSLLVTFAILKPKKPLKQTHNAFLFFDSVGLGNARCLALVVWVQCSHAHSVLNSCE